MSIESPTEVLCSSKYDRHCDHEAVPRSRRVTQKYGNPDAPASVYRSVRVTRSVRMSMSIESPTEVLCSSTT
ncbi:MAG: hypothetical protein VXY93_16560, partial [Pseudomonadota bacterium]|nr:hypothetical protein [Pseudomonadota bacterium]